MVNEHASRDPADWQNDRHPDRRPGKKPRLSDNDPDAEHYGYRSRAGPPEREYDHRDRHRDYDHRDRADPRERDMRDELRDERGDPRDRRDERVDAPGASGSVEGAPLGSPTPAGVRLLLANLSYNTTEAQIVDFFRDAGAEVQSVKLVKVSNRVNGNAYVWMVDERSVDIALEMDGREFLGRTLRVSAMPEDQRTACVRGLRPGSTAADVEDLFRGCKILDVRCRPVKGGPPDMNTWFVDFGDEESFSRALAKDRTIPGLMICIATAQGRGGNRTPRDKMPGGPPGRDDMDRPMPMPMREEFDRGGPSSRDDYDRPSRSRDGFDKRPDDRDAYDRKGPGSSQDFEEQERMGGKDRNGVNGGPPAGRGRSRSRSRSPGRGYDRGRGHDRYPEHDRMRGDRRMDYDRGYGSRSGDRERWRSPPRDDRYRDRYDRGDDRDRRDYRRDYDRWGDRDRDHRRDRDRDRDYDRGDYGRMDRRGSRYDREGPDYRHRDARDGRDRPLDPVVTTVLTNLPFCEDREHVINNLGNTLTDLSDQLKVKEIIPVGRRCGAAIVVFRDEEAKAHAVGMQSITIMSRKVNILPLEVPSVARVQKLLPGFSVNEILDDMQRHYGVESLFVKLKQSDQLLLGVEDSRYLVRLLDIDGRPLLSSRYATVSYIPSRQYSDSLAGRTRRPPNEFDDPNSRGGYRDRGDRDDRGGSPGNDRRRSGDMGPDDRRDTGDQGSAGDRDSRGYQHNGSEWKVRLDGVPENMTGQDILKAFESAGLAGIAVDKKGQTPLAFVRGGETGQREMEEVIALYNDKRNSPFKYTTDPAVVIRECAKRSAPGEPIDDLDKTAPSPKKLKPSTDEDWKTKTHATPLSSTCSRGFRVSPMTPSPGDYGFPPKTKKEPLDPNLPDTCRRLEQLRPIIMEGPSKPDNDDNYELFCKSLHKMCEPQKLVHTTANNIDPAPPQVWTGDVKKGSGGPPALCYGYLVLNSSQNEESVRKSVNEMPKCINIERRVSWSHESLAHLLVPDTVVTVLKAADDGPDDGDGREVDKNGVIGKASRAAMNGILKSLRGKQSMGLCRYVLPGTEKKYVALCIPPNPYVFEKMRVPWRFRDFAGHDSLLLVVGPRNRER